MLFLGKIEDTSLVEIKKIIAKEAVFYPRKKFEERLQTKEKNQHLILHKTFRMCRINQKIRKQYTNAGLSSPQRRTIAPNLLEMQEDIYFTDNGNAEINRAFREIGFLFNSGKYEFCHIGTDTAYHPETFGTIPNLVYLPRWIASTTDHLPEIQDFLLAKSYSLYGDLMKKYMTASETAKFFISLCNQYNSHAQDKRKKFETIKNKTDIDKYQWEKTDFQ